MAEIKFGFIDYPEWRGRTVDRVRSPLSCRTKSTGRYKPAFFIFAAFYDSEYAGAVFFQSTDPPAAKVTFVRGVLRDIGGVTFFRSKHDVRAWARGAALNAAKRRWSQEGGSQD